nr:MAG: hypothetical protein [Bacteriophage sp.]
MMTEQQLTSIQAEAIVPVAVLKLRYVELPPEEGENVWSVVAKTERCTDELLKRVMPKIGFRPDETDARDYLAVTADAFEGGICTLEPDDLVIIHSNGSYNFIVGKDLTASIYLDRLILTVN